MAYGLEAYRSNGTLLLSSEFNYLKVVERIVVPATFYRYLNTSNPYTTLTIQTPYIDVPSQYVVDVNAPQFLDINVVYGYVNIDCKATPGLGSVAFSYRHILPPEAQISRASVAQSFYLTVFKK